MLSKKRFLKKIEIKMFQQWSEKFTDAAFLNYWWLNVPSNSDTINGLHLSLLQTNDYCYHNVLFTHLKYASITHLLEILMGEKYVIGYENFLRLDADTFWDINHAKFPHSLFCVLCLIFIWLLTTCWWIWSVAYLYCSTVNTLVL